ncbi:MAG: hypothetical protein WAU16_10715 [Rhizobiaceae bacterium]
MRSRRWYPDRSLRLANGVHPSPSRLMAAIPFLPIWQASTRLPICSRPLQEAEPGARLKNHFAVIEQRLALGDELDIEGRTGRMARNLAIAFVKQK